MERRILFVKSVSEERQNSGPNLDSLMCARVQLVSGKSNKGATYFDDGINRVGCAKATIGTNMHA